MSSSKIFHKAIALCVLNNHTIMDINSRRLLAAFREDSTMRGTVLRHKDGAITITRGRELKQKFNLN